jgi:hypothetical protein
VLKESLVYAKTKCETLEAVVHLNLWGSQLSDVSLVSQMANVEIISLSVNQISSLEPFSYCPKLSELYLRKNNIHTIEEVVYLKDLQNLRLLWLNDNPCADHPHYTTFVVRMLPQLARLDNEVVTPREREEAKACEQEEVVQMNRYAMDLLYSHGGGGVKYDKALEEAVDRGGGSGSVNGGHAPASKVAARRPDRPPARERPPAYDKNIVKALMQKIEQMDERQKHLERNLTELQAKEDNAAAAVEKGQAAGPGGKVAEGAVVAVDEGGVDAKLRALEVRLREEHIEAINSLERRIVDLEIENKLLKETWGETESQSLPEKHEQLNTRVREIERRFTLVASAAGSGSGGGSAAQNQERPPGKERGKRTSSTSGKSSPKPRSPGGRSEEI